LIFYKEDRKLRTQVTLLKELPGVEVGTKALLQTDGFTFRADSYCYIHTFEGVKALPDWFKIEEVYEESDVVPGSYWKSDGVYFSQEVIFIDKDLNGIAVYKIRNVPYVFTFTRLGLNRLLCEKRLNPATEIEIKDALVKEAIRRGLNDLSKKIKKPTCKNLVWKMRDFEWEHNRCSDTLYYYGNEIYCKGVWAEIIEEKQIDKEALKNAVVDIQNSIEVLKKLLED
jgi:hypothetical protein